LGGAARRRAGVDGEGAVLQIRRPVRVDGVDQTPLLTYFLEQAARHAAAEDLVQDRQGETVFVAARERAHADHEVRLLGRAGADDLRPRRTELEAVPHGPLAGSGRHAALETCGQLVVVQVPG